MVCTILCDFSLHTKYFIPQNDTNWNMSSMNLFPLYILYYPYLIYIVFHIFVQFYRKLVTHTHIQTFLCLLFNYCKLVESAYTLHDETQTLFSVTSCSRQKFKFYFCFDKKNYNLLSFAFFQIIIRLTLTIFFL